MTIPIMRPASPKEKAPGRRSLGRKPACPSSKHARNLLAGHFYKSKT
ncbi:MAG: hypothetical protein U0800_01030 [Isosphaeraceae bacterium]